MTWLSTLQWEKQNRDVIELKFTYQIFINIIKMMWQNGIKLIYKAYKYFYVVYYRNSPFCIYLI